MFTNNRRWLLTLLLLCCGVASGCAFILRPQTKASESAEAKSSTITDAESSQIASLEVDAAKDYNATLKYAAQIRSYLNHESFDQIDEIADTVRAGKTRFSGGHWKLNKLYKGLSEPANYMRAPDAVWRAQIGRLKKWVEQKPKSITARVALGAAYVEYAWYARGSGYADTITEDGRSLYGDRLVLAENVLNDAQKLDAKCPHLHFVMQILAKGQGWERSLYEKNYEAGIALEPTYHYLYSEKAQYLLPRWFGEEGEWERFAEETSKRLGGKLGSIIYYRIAIDLAYYYKDRTFFTETQISWPKMKQGFADVEEAYGVSMANINLLCQIAGQAGDRPFTQYLLTRIGDTWDPEVWKTRKYFEHYKAWAYDRR